MSEEQSTNVVQSLKQLNFKANDGLLCLLGVDPGGQNLEEDVQEKNNSENTEVSTHNVVDGGTCAAISNGETESIPTITESGASSCDINLVKKVSKAVGRNKSIANKCKVYVGNIGYKVRRREFREFFSAFGRILSSEIMEDRIKKRSRGFGFVTFSNEWEAQKAKDSTDEERTLHSRVMTVLTPTRKRKGGPVHMEQSLEEALEELKSLSLIQAKESAEHESESANAEEIGTPSMSILNDDIIIHIFSFLGVKDKIRAELVCTRWRYIVLSVWPSVTHLDFKDTFSLYKGGLTDDILLRIFQRGCKNLKSLDLSACPYLLTDFTVHCIAKHCKNLKTVNLSGVKVSSSSLRTLAKACKKLETLILYRCYTAGEKGLWWVFKECSNLKHIDISDNRRVTGKCFFMLHLSVESINVTDCARLTNEGVAFIGNKCRNLKSIDLSGCASLTDAGIIDLLLNCTQIEKFYFRKSPQTVTSSGLHLVISRLRELMVLDLSECSAVDDELLLHLGSSSSNLISLNIQGCIGNITDDGMQSLVSCDRLSSLVISYIDGITNNSISQIASNGTLQRFVARSCDGISDDVVQSLLDNCMSLRELDVSGCVHVTDTSLEHMKNCYTTSDNRCELTLVIGGTSITEEFIVSTQNECHKLNIITHNLSSGTLWLGNQRFFSMPQFYLDDEDDDDEDDDDDDVHGYNNDNHTGHDDNFHMDRDEYDDFLEADYPSMDDEQEWMFSN